MKDEKNHHGAELMIMASHQTFSGKLWHLTGQTKFDHTSLLYIINGEINESIIGKQISRQFLILIISTVVQWTSFRHNNNFVNLMQSLLL